MSGWIRSTGSALLLALTSCSMGPVPEVCEANTQCRDAFGLGWMCGEAGYCEAASPHARCDATWPTDLFERPESYSDAIVLGSLFDHSTDMAEVRSAELAVRQANDQKGLDGRSFAIIHCDYQQDLTIDALDLDGAARQTARWLAEVYGVQALVGPATSEQVLAVYEEVEADDVMILSPSATSPELTELDGPLSNDGNPGLLWRTVPPDDLQGTAIAIDLLDRGVSGIAILHEEGAYGTVLADVIEGRFSGVENTVHRFGFANETQIADVLTDAVYQEGVEEILFLSGDVGDILAFLDAAALQPRFTEPPGVDDPPPPRIFLGDGAAVPLVLDSVSADLVPLIRGSRPEVPGGPVYDVFASGYGAAYDGEDPRQSIFTSFTYDAAWLAMYGTAWSLQQEGKIHGPGIGRGLRRVSGPATETLPIRPSSWPVVVETFGQALRIDVQGASGDLDFDPTTGETSLPYEIWVIQDDAFEAVALCTRDGCDPLTEESGAL